MSEITEILPQVKDKRRCNVYLDGQFFCGLTLEVAMKNRLKKGTVITREELSKIQLESEKQTALDKALVHISASQKTEKEVRAFLQKKGFLEGTQDYVIEKMKGYAFIDDEQYAKSYAQSAVKKKGKKSIVLSLKQKGINEKAIEEATKDLDGEEETAKRILEKYMRGKEENRETFYKAFRHLLSKGFDYEIAKKTLSDWGMEEDE